MAVIILYPSPIWGFCALLWEGCPHTPNVSCQWNRSPPESAVHIKQTKPHGRCVYVCKDDIGAAPEIETQIKECGHRSGLLWQRLANSSEGCIFNHPCLIASHYLYPVKVLRSQRLPCCALHGASHSLVSVISQSGMMSNPDFNPWWFHSPCEGPSVLTPYSTLWLHTGIPLP